MILDQPFLDGNGDRLRTVARTQLDRDLFDLALDRSLAPMDLSGDLFVGRTVGDPREHVDFILGQLVFTAGLRLGENVELPQHLIHQ